MILLIGRKTCCNGTLSANEVLAMFTKSKQLFSDIEKTLHLEDGVLSSIVLSQITDIKVIPY